jgi:hypothetical protein
MSSSAPSPSPSETGIVGATIRIEAISPPVDRHRYRIEVEGLPEHPVHALPEVLALELPGGAIVPIDGVISALDGRGYHGLLDKLPPEGTWVRWGHAGHDTVRIARVGGSPN